MLTKDTIVHYITARFYERINWLSVYAGQLVNWIVSISFIILHASSA